MRGHWAEPSPLLLTETEQKDNCAAETMDSGVQIQTHILQILPTLSQSGHLPASHSEAPPCSLG